MGKGPFLPDIERLIKMGINPKTGLPIKMGDPKCKTKEGFKKAIRIIDEQDAVNRYRWYNLPMNLTSQEVERMLYYRGQLAFFYFKDLDEFYFMPYALEGGPGGGLDFYGRYRQIHPIPWNSGGNNGKQVTAQQALLSTYKLDVQYGIILPEDLEEKDLYHSAVLLKDYTKQLSEEIIPRVNINDEIIDLEAECMPYMRTSLLMGTGVRGVRVNDTDQEDSVYEGSRNMAQSALEGNPYIPITGTIEFQEMTNGAPTKSEDYLIAMQAIDNLRLSTYGIDNGGLFEKKAHMLEAEAEINGGPVGLVLQDGLSIRQEFCNIVNSIWGLGIWCEPSENISKVDINGDGVMYDRDDNSSNVGIDTSESEVDEND